MKRIKIIILLSVFLGFSSVYAQTSKTDTNKNDQENKIERTDPEIKTVSQPQVLNEGEETPATAKPLTDAQRQNLKEDEVFVKTRPYPSERDPSREAQAKLKDTPVITTDNRSGTLYTPANPDPDKNNSNVKNNDHE